ncbi:MAG: NUDIX hydrolase [Acidimicrobiia bacterium]|nr:NUDIX hydrolase [Acidimicrobiia bacterium]
MARHGRRAYAVITKKGKVLVVKNEKGRWTLPGGRAKRGEALRDAVRREVEEETGLDVKLGRRLSGRHIRIHGDDCGGCVVYRAVAKKGKPKPRSEIVEVAWADPDDVPSMLPAFRRKRVRKMLAAIT